MNAISRRSFLKLAGTTVVATAGVSMLTGCSWFDDVEIIVVVNGKEEARKKLPYVAVQIAAGSKSKARELIKKYGPEEYRNVEFEFDDAYAEALGRKNCKIEKNADGKWEMILAITTVDSTVEYEVIVNKQTVATGTTTIPNGVDEIDKETALKLVKEKLGDKYDMNRIQLDESVANNRKVVNGKLTIAVSYGVG